MIITKTSFCMLFFDGETVMENHSRKNDLQKRRPDRSGGCCCDCAGELHLYDTETAPTGISLLVSDVGEQIFWEVSQYI